MLAFLCYHSPLLLMSLHLAYCIRLDVMLSLFPPPLFFLLQLFTLPANQKLVALVYLQHFKILNVQAHYSKTAFIYSGWSLKPCKQESHCTCPVGVKEAAIVILSSWHLYFFGFPFFFNLLSRLDLLFLGDKSQKCLFLFHTSVSYVLSI